MCASSAVIVAGATGASVADAILKNWNESLKKFHKVMPVEYKKALAKLATVGGAEEVKHG